MKKISKTLAAAGLAVGLVVGGGAVAANASGYNYVYVGGGVWEYGDGLITYSDFKQGSRYHTSSVIVAGQLNRSAKTSPGVRSHAQLKTGKPGTNSAYWNNL